MTEKEQQLVDLLSDQYWRLNNLYKIKDKAGKLVTFRMNEAQEDLYNNQWYRNIILKARQLGFSTFIDLFILDTALFNPGFRGGIIAHNRQAANTIFDEKIKTPYSHLPDEIKAKVKATTDRAGEMQFSNGSTVSVSTSFRSGTLQILHVSELGSIAINYPKKAIEIKTGAFEAVARDQQIFIESTAEGRSGLFYEMCTTGKAVKDSKAKLTNMDFKFHFFPWWQNPEYVMEIDNVLWTAEDIRYFKDLEAQEINLTGEQQAWWIKKHEVLGEDMYREHPSYPEEAFKASVIGAFYGKTVTDLRRKGMITHATWERGFPVHTGWDLGMNDTMVIWFLQEIGRERRIIDYFEGSGESLDYYVKALNSKPYVYGRHHLPHDVNVRELQTGRTRLDRLKELGVNPIIVVPRPKNNDHLLNQIEDTRSFLSMCWIDEANCSTGLKGLENYRREWDDKQGTFRSSPLHNWASHPSDGFRTLAVGYKTGDMYESRDLTPEVLPDY